MLRAVSRRDGRGSRGGEIMRRRPGPAPVATTMPSVRTCRPPVGVTVRGSGSSRTARSPSGHCTSRASYSSASPSASASASRSPLRKSSDSGGRSWGVWRSSPTTTISPSWPSARSARTVLRPAGDAPTTVMLLMPAPDEGVVSHNTTSIAMCNMLSVARGCCQEGGAAHWFPNAHSVAQFATEVPEGGRSSAGRSVGPVQQDVDHGFIEPSFGGVQGLFAPDELPRSVYRVPRRRTK